LEQCLTPPWPAHGAARRSAGKSRSLVNSRTRGGRDRLAGTCVAVRSRAAGTGRAELRTDLSVVIARESGQSSNHSHIRHNCRVSGIMAQTPHDFDWP
jgi:hypothetical protein